MKQQSEKHQQINDLGKMPSSVRDSFGLIIGGTGAESDASLTQPGSLDVLITALARKRHGHPQRDRIVVLIGQCRNYGKFPGMGERILETIDKLEQR